MHMTTENSAEGKTRVMLEITEDMKQIYGNVHGGAIAGLMDSCMAVAVNQQLKPDQGASMVSLKVDFMRSTKQGPLWGEGRVIKKGSKIVFAEGEIRDDAGNVVAFGTGTFIII